MKKTLTFLCVLCMLLMLTACGASDTQPFSGGSGTETDPYLISTAADLWEMAEKMNTKESVEEFTAAHYRMTADIDLGGKKEWIPIGYYAVNTDYFRFEGTFDGTGHTIRGIRIDYKDPVVGQKRSLFGLFGQMEGTVRNLTIDDSTILAEGEQSVRAGAIAGKVWGGTLENCHTTESVRVSGSYETGGICGNIDSGIPISGCTNAANVTATGTVGDAGGISARAGCPVVSCTNSGSISASQGQAAGIAVSANSGLTDCTNSGDVTAEDYAAGIVCSFDDGALNHSMNNDTVALLRCINSGSITSTGKQAGGIAAGCRTGSIVDCTNSGSVTAPKETGGIFAYFQHSAFGAPAEVFTVTGCSNTGAVTSAENYAAGGICGMVYGDKTRLVFENCINTGAVKAVGQTDVLVSGAEAGGIIGEGSVSALEIRSCHNAGEVYGFAACGGILGSVQPVREAETTLLLAESCTNSGSVFAVNPGGLTQEIYAGGIVGYCAVETADEELLPAFDTVQIENCENTGTLDGDREPDILCTDDLCGNLPSRLQ